MPLKLPGELPESVLEDANEGGFLEGVGEFAGGLVVGARRDPLLKLGVDAAAGILGFDGAELDDLERSLESSRISDVGEFIGEYGFTIAAGAGAFGLGRAALTGVLRSAAPKLAAREASLVGRQVAQLQARLASEKALATGVGEVARAGGVTGLERGAQILGGSVGIGALEGSEALAEGRPLTEAGQAAALGALLTAGGEFGLTLAGRALSRTARKVDTQALRGRALSEAAPELERRAAVRRGSAEQLRQNLIRITGTENYDEEVIAALGRRKRGKALTALRRFRAADEEAQRLETLAASLDDVVDERFLRTEPLSTVPGTARSATQQVLQKIAQTPEASAGKLGVTVTRVVKELDDALIEVEAANAIVPQMLQRKFVNLAARLGRGKIRSTKDVDRVLGDVFERYELSGVDGVRQNFGDDAGRFFQELGEELQRMQSKIAAGSGKPGAQLMSARELRAKGVQAYLPQYIKRGRNKSAREDLVKFFTKRGMDPESARVRADDLLVADKVKGLERSGSLDFQRKLPGTLREKAAGGNFEGYGESLVRYFQDANQRISIGKRFGFEKAQVNRYIDAVKLAAAKEGADTTLTDNLLRGLFQRTYEDAALQRFASAVTSAEAGLKLSFTALQNLSQNTLTAVFNGTKNFSRGVLRATRSGQRAEAARALAVGESEFTLLNRAFGDKGPAGPFQRFANVVLKTTGFTAAERINRVVAGTSTVATINDVLARGLRGKLRGTTLDAARRQLGALDLDLDRILRTQRAAVDRALADGGSMAAVVDAAMGAGAYQRAIFRGARTTQFMPSSTRIPLAWGSPLGRILFQFKSFALNQGIFIRDRVLGEAAAGNVKPLTTMTAVYPLVGEAVANSLSALKGRDRPDDALAYTVETLSVVGGFGLVQSALIGADRGRLLELMAGPAVSDFAKLSENLVQADFEGMKRQVVAQPTFQAAQRVLGLGAGVVDVLDDYFAEPDVPADFESYSELLRRR